MSRRSAALAVVVAGVVLVLSLLGARGSWPGGGSTALRGLPSEAEVAEAVRGAPAGSALHHAGQLPVRGRAPRTGYDRERFGAGWGDPDRNGCDARNDVLARDLTDVVVREGTGGCVVLAGTLEEPFSSTTVRFRRGEGTSDDVQIDHVVALSDAWQKGAQQWSPAVRVAFANDPLNLLAVDGALNGQKSDADAATWLPPSQGFRCEYVARQVAVKHDYGLWVTEAERAAVVAVLSRCPEQPLPR